MAKLGAQVTETNPADNVYCVTQLEQTGPNGEYTTTGGVIWVDKAKPNPEDRMKQAVVDCLTARFTKHSKK